MSMDISGLLGDKSGGRYISLLAVNNRHRPVEELADYVKRLRFEKGLSQREVEVKSGNRISKGYIGQIENREVLGHSVTPQKLQALAVGLGVSEDEIFAVARGKSLEPMTPTDFRSALDALGVSQIQSAGGLDLDNLTTEDQQEVVEMITALITQKLRRRQAGAGGKGKKR